MRYIDVSVFFFFETVRNMLLQKHILRFFLLLLGNSNDSAAVSDLQGLELFLFCFVFTSYS